MTWGFTHSITIFVATYSFVPFFRKAKFCGVSSQAVDKVGCAVAKRDCGTLHQTTLVLQPAQSNLPLVTYSCKLRLRLHILFYRLPRCHKSSGTSCVPTNILHLLLTFSIRATYLVVYADYCTNCEASRYVIFFSPFLISSLPGIIMSSSQILDELHSNKWTSVWYYITSRTRRSFLIQKTAVAAFQIFLITI
jgi:hypothetical protein